MLEALVEKSKFPWRLFSRLVLVQTVLVVLALGASGFVARYFFEREFVAQIERQLRVTLQILGRDLSSTPDQLWCTRHSREQALRITLIDSSGRVLCDSQHDPTTMENHGERPEVVAARRDGFGNARRKSATLGDDELYLAVQVNESHPLVLRGSIPLSELAAALRLFDRSLAAFLVLIAAVIGGFSIWSARSLVFPIGRLLLKAKGVLHGSSRLLDEELNNENSYGELSDLESSLENIRRDLELKAERLNIQTEEQATLMSAISDLILAVDLEGAPLFYNSRFAVLFGREGRLYEMVRDPEILEVYREALKEGKAGLVAAVPIDQEGSRKYFSVSVSPLRRTSGDVYGAVGIFHDVTDLKRTEQIRIDFVANVSHELRTPLTAIKGYADTLAQDLEQGRPATKEFVDIITRNTTRLMSLINDLLDLSSLDANADTLQKSALSTEEVTARVIAQMNSVFVKKNQSVSCEASTPTVLADVRRLEQVLVNLLDNASKYTPAGGSLRVVWEQDPKGPRAILLKVIDAGPGIPTEHHGRLFERFYRVDKARSRELGGTGLGLAIVKHIMQRHGGSVWVESIVGKGATFVCRFRSDA